MAHYTFTKGVTSISEVSPAVELLTSITIEGTSPSPQVYNGCDTDMYLHMNINTEDNCSQQNLNSNCMTVNGKEGICLATPTSTDNSSHPTICMYKCVPKQVNQYNVDNINIPLYNIQSYWNTYKNELMENLEYISSANPSNIWVIAPSPSEIDVVCSQSCIDNNPLCDVTSDNINTYCGDGRGRDNCCLCNPGKWSRTPYFVGETEPTGYSYTSNFNMMSNTIGSSGMNSQAEKLHNIFNIPSPTELVFKKAKTGYLKPYYLGSTTSENDCYFPLPSTSLPSASTPTNKYYEYDINTNIDNYVFGKPIISTYLNEGNSIIIDEYSTTIPSSYFYTSTPTTILGKKGYHEQCFYGSKESNGNCPTTCPKDMINPVQNSINTHCTRCEPGTGEIYEGANECSPCYAINKLISNSKPYGCTDCPDNEIFVKSTNECKPCSNTNHTILTMCENTENHICPSPTYEVNLIGNNKKEFYNNCYSNHPSCQVTEHCIFKDDTVNVTPTSLPDSVIPTHNLYMNEVCKTITNSNSCDLVEECKWFNEHSKCFIKLPTPSPSHILIPMSIPSNISDEDTLRQLNAFSTPSSSDGNPMHCSVPNSDHEYDILNFWNGQPTPTIPESETSCQPGSIPSIRINNKYTNSELNVYAHPYSISSSDTHISPCEYYGCVHKDKYYEASIPEFIGPLCQELHGVYNYYNNVNVIKPNSLSDLVNNPTQYGCLLTKHIQVQESDCLCPNGTPASSGCTTTNPTKCSSCNSGYEKNNNICEVKGCDNNDYQEWTNIVKEKCCPTNTTICSYGDSDWYPRVPPNKDTDPPCPIDCINTLDLMKDSCRDEPFFDTVSTKIEDGKRYCNMIPCTCPASMGGVADSGYCTRDNPIRCTPH